MCNVESGVRTRRCLLYSQHSYEELREETELLELSLHHLPHRYLRYQPLEYLESLGASQFRKKRGQQQGRVRGL